MTPVDLEAARKVAREAAERAEKATPGPWHKADCVSPKIVIYAAPQGPHGFGDTKTLYLGETYCDQKGQGRANLTFIAAARSDVPDLAGLVLAMAGELERARLGAVKLREEAAQIAECCSGGDHLLSKRDLIAQQIRALQVPE